MDVEGEGSVVIEGAIVPLPVEEGAAGQMEEEDIAVLSPAAKAAAVAANQYEEDYYKS